VNLYFRWANSYREPGITERYILRNFGDPTFSVLLAANTGLRPERGNSYDAGVKIHRKAFRGSAAYFRNDFKDFLKPSFSDALFVPADPASGLQPLAPGFPFHGVLYVQRTNTARARIEGFEGDLEASLALGGKGSITPFGVIGYLRGADLTPDPSALALIAQFYNRSDTPVRLKGAATDAPLSGITPLRVVAGAKFASKEGRWFGEYRMRYQSRVERVDPLDLSTTIVTQYGTLRSLSAFALHSVRAGITHRKESYRLSLVMGVDNLTNRFYFEHFQNAPARGRSFVIGVTTEFWNLLGR
jgi:outer membrane receptor protein involved in Fe transport